MTKTETKTLDDRIADAFEAEMSSAALKSLLDEVSQVDAKAKAESEAASKIAFDPAVRPAKVDEARKAMEDANFRSKRMNAATERLTELHGKAIERERSALVAKEQAAARAERDELTKDLKQYAELAPKIAALLQRLQANNERLKRALGEAGAWESAEMIARGLPEGWAARPDELAPELLHTTRLPKFTKDGTLHGYLWPPARTMHSLLG